MMTSGQMRAQLEEANRNLSDAVEQLLAGPIQNPGFHQSLQTAAQLLDHLCGAGWQPAGPLPMGPLHSLQANAARAQRLLDSAAAFYGCAISPSSSETVVYTPDGALVLQGGN